MILAVIFLFHTHDIGNSYHNSCRCRILCPLYNSCCTWHFPDDTAGSTPKHILQDLAPSLVAWRCVPMLAKEQRITQGGSWGWEENAWLGLMQLVALWSLWDCDGGSSWADFYTLQRPPLCQLLFFTTSHRMICWTIKLSQNNFTSCSIAHPIFCHLCTGRSKETVTNGSVIKSVFKFHFHWFLGYF